LSLRDVKLEDAADGRGLTLVDDEVEFPVAGLAERVGSLDPEPFFATDIEPVEPVGNAAVGPTAGLKGTDATAYAVAGERAGVGMVLLGQHEIIHAAFGRVPVDPAFADRVKVDALLPQYLLGEGPCPSR
jgi:hypothetical protein